MRYLAHTNDTRAEMLKDIGASQIDDLFVDVPSSARLKKLIDLPHHQSEYDVERQFQSMADKNISAGSVPCFLGAGAYRHHIPASVDALIQRGEFLTSYTPYQPEISQGTLQYLFEFQTQVALLTGMDVANASLYDGATATVEAVLMANRVTKRHEAIISGNLHPHYREVVETYGRYDDFKVTTRPSAPAGEKQTFQITDQTACVVVQYPDFFGHITDFTELAEQCHKNGALLIVVVTEIVALGLLKPPGDFGADIVVGEGMSLGVGLNFGGPTVGLFATRDQYVRQMPGRIAGQTVDVEGKRGWVLTLSAREQHIRREKATSNICTNSGLCALAFTIHLSLLGEVGLQRLARLNHARTLDLYKRLKAIEGIHILNKTFFNEFTVELPVNAAKLVDQLATKKILAGVPVSRLIPGSHENHLLLAVTETTQDDHMDQLVKEIKKVLP